jgi:hypothetical protein
MADLSTASGVNFTNYAAIVAGTSGVGNFPNGTNQWGTKLRVMYDTYTVGAADTLHTDCVLTMGVLPKGAIPLAVYFAQSGAGEAAVATVKIATVAITGTNALTDMTSATQQLLPVLSTASDSALTADSVVTLDFATADVDAATVLVFAIFYISAED